MLFDVTLSLYELKRKCIATTCAPKDGYMLILDYMQLLKEVAGIINHSKHLNQLRISSEF
jgi:hypothetical protein